MSPLLIAFVVMATAVLAGGIICMWSRYVVHSAFGLMLSLVGVAGFYVLLGSDYLAIAQIVMYVGGVVVLYLFGVMLTPPDIEERSVPRLAVLAALALAAIVILLRSLKDMTFATAAAPVAPPEGTVIYGLGRQLLAKDGYLLPFELASVLLLVALIGAVFIARRREVQ
jgi:NADH-quinone oxidoreductase subunit J